MKGFRLAGAALVCLLIASCGSSRPQDLIVGTWQYADSPAGAGLTKEFTKDGKYRSAVVGSTVERRYRFVDDSTIEFSDEDGGAKSTYKVAVTRDDMTLTSGDNRVEKFKRVR